ncbi:hypothetical protein LX32DRAFT_223447 [Colletotrichum zoysiae]|uniref:Uncharacterized protein n=1 Tax=Colletotrichum zoysiae TaxID=1216348 RepID=A0AAD9LXH0_9PEZI|nr:hypothetical protein LX32DRAFT_223447 [Colletotrichum zoysiae]
MASFHRMATCTPPPPLSDTHTHSLSHPSSNSRSIRTGISPSAIYLPSHTHPYQYSAICRSRPSWTTRPPLESRQQSSTLPIPDKLARHYLHPGAPCLRSVEAGSRRTASQKSPEHTIAPPSHPYKQTRTHQATESRVCRRKTLPSSVCVAPFIDQPPPPLFLPGGLDGKRKMEFREGERCKVKKGGGETTTRACDVVAIQVITTPTQSRPMHSGQRRQSCQDPDIKVVRSEPTGFHGEIRQKD